MRILTKNSVTFEKWDGNWGWKNLILWGFTEKFDFYGENVHEKTKKGRIALKEGEGWYPNAHYRYKKLKPKY